MKYNLFAPAISISFLITLLANCCPERKCLQTELWRAFRITDAQNGSDLIFGPNRCYDPYLVKMFSVSGSDTVYHNIRPGKYSPPPVTDSLLLGELSFGRYETIYVRLNQVDTDTMKISYGYSDGGNCCRDSY